jgi:protein TonB
MTEVRPGHLLPALVVATALHAVAAILIFDEIPSPGAAGAGEGGLEIGMGLAGAAPGREGVEAAAPVRQDAAPAATVRPADPSEVEAGAPPDPPLAEPDHAEVQSVEAVPAQPDGTPEPAAPTVPEVAAARLPSGEVTPNLPEAVAPADPPEAATAGDMPRDRDAGPSRPAETSAPRAVRADVVTAATSEPTEQMAAAPSSAPPPQARPVRAEPQRVRASRAEPGADRTEAIRRRAAGPAPSKREDHAAAPASETGSEGRTAEGEATGSGGNAGSGRTASLGGDPGARSDYMAQIAAILAREKRYPRRARIRREEGTGHLRFTLDASGRVIAQSIARSTGHSSLDEEIAALLGRVAPLPPIPTEVGRDTLEIVVPIRFRLR